LADDHHPKRHHRVSGAYLGIAAVMMKGDGTAPRVNQAGIDVPEGSILIAEEMTPSDTISLDRDKIRGFITATGEIRPVMLRSLRDHWTS